MKTMKQILLGLCAVLLATACEKDGDKIYLTGLEEAGLMATADQVVLSLETSKQIVLSLAWDNSTLVVSNPTMSAPNILTNTVQVSTSSNFATVVESLEPSTSKAYTGSELNTVAKNLNMVSDAAATMYFRIKSSIANNMEPVYSNVVEVSVTPYLINMGTGFILDKDKADTGVTLASPDWNGIYTGFIGATSWYNFYMQEGDGTVWGNSATDGTFYLSSGEDKWNCWFPESGGCYYTIINTVKKQWSALYIPVLTVSGDLTGDMTFDRPNVKWMLPFSATQTSMTVKISGTGAQYDYSTGDSGGGTSTPVAFAQNGGNITFAESAGNITVTVAKAGDYTLILDLSNPEAWTCTTIEGSVEPDKTPQTLYLPGLNDAVTENNAWLFDQYLSLYDENNLAYAGVAYANSLWGYTLNIEKDNWNDKYTYASGDATAGTLEWAGPTNMPIPTTGTYLFEVSTKALTYQLTALGNEIYYSGLNDNWDFHALQATSQPGVYAGSITIDHASEWGFKFYLFNGNWDQFFGGYEGTLYYKGDGAKDDATLAPGTYTLTVNLPAWTYSITQ